MKAIKITTDNEISTVTVPEPTWKGMGQLVGGHFETVRPWGLYDLNTPYKEQLLMLVNREGRLIWLERNIVGTALYNNTPTSTRFEPIVGDILIMTEGFVNGELDIVGLDDEQLHVVMTALKNKFKYLTEVEDEIN